MCIKTERGEEISTMNATYLFLWKIKEIFNENYNVHVTNVLQYFIFFYFIFYFLLCHISVN